MREQFIGLTNNSIHKWGVHWFTTWMNAGHAITTSPKKRASYFLGNARTKETKWRPLANEFKNFSLFTATDRLKLTGIYFYMFSTSNSCGSWNGMKLILSKSQVVCCYVLLLCCCIVMCCCYVLLCIVVMCCYVLLLCVVMYCCYVLLCIVVMCCCYVLLLCVIMCYYVVLL